MQAYRQQVAQWRAGGKQGAEPQWKGPGEMPRGTADYEAAGNETWSRGGGTGPGQDAEADVAKQAAKQADQVHKSVKADSELATRGADRLASQMVPELTRLQRLGEQLANSPNKPDVVGLQEVESIQDVRPSCASTGWRTSIPTSSSKPARTASRASPLSPRAVCGPTGNR